MRWFAFLILAYIAIGLQLGLSGLVGPSINFVMIAAVFIAINATQRSAIFACLAIGLVHDIVSNGPIGLFATAYGLAAVMLAVDDRPMASDHPATHFIATLLGGIALAIIQWLVSKIGRFNMIAPLGQGCMFAFYTAVVAVPLMGVLTRIRKAFRFR